MCRKSGVTGGSAQAFGTTGMEVRMKEPYEKGVAIRSAPSFALVVVRRPVKRKQGGAADKAANLAG